MPDKTSAEHYDAAERLLEEAESYQTPDTRAEWCLELAKMHLAMSQASIAKEALDLRMKASAGTEPDLSVRGSGGPRRAPRS